MDNIVFSSTFLYADFVMVARITEKVRRKKTTENAEQGCTETTTSPSTAPCRSKIKQALRLKCNLIFHKKSEEGKQGL